jgi:hypothetical protein
MPTFRIDRQFPDGTTQDDLDAAAVRSEMCLRRYPDLHWKRSYWEAKAFKMQYFYGAPDETLIWRHAADAHIPCDTVTEVVEWVPEDVAGPSRDG